MSDRAYNILFVCTGNSARSILAEALTNHLAHGRLKAFSAGSMPKGAVHPLTLQTLAHLKLPSDGLHSKGWETFASVGAPQMDFVITLCDQAAGEACPAWPGQPVTAHWGLPDPTLAEGGEPARQQAMLDVAVLLKRRIELLLALPIATLDKMSLQGSVRDIAQQTQGAATHVLILCTHNSARSVLAEGMLNHWARRFGKNVQGHSAGSAPSGRINPFAIEALQAAGIDTAGYRSKSWDEFSRPGAPPLAIVITVCDSAAAEQCPVFFGGDGEPPVKVHWGYPDPSNADGGDEGKRRAFELTRQAIGYRMLQLLQLPLGAMSKPELQRALVGISGS